MTKPDRSDIEKLAYYIWEHLGKTQNRARACWLCAEYILGEGNSLENAIAIFEWAEHFKIKIVNPDKAG